MGRPRGRPRKNRPTKNTRRSKRSGNRVSENVKAEPQVSSSSSTCEAEVPDRAPVCFVCNKRERKRNKKNPNKGPNDPSGTVSDMSSVGEKGWETIQKVAKLSQREDILQRVQPLFGKTADEVELWYHQLCFVEFTKEYLRPSPHLPVDEQGYCLIMKKPFEALCEQVIKERIIANRAVMTSKLLQRKYRRFVSKLNGVRISRKSNPRNLKRKLMETFPELHFERAKKRWYYPEIVFTTRTLEVEDILTSESDNLPHGVDTDSESDLEGDSQSDSDGGEDDDEAKNTGEI
ncbi:hypothetical protein BaRGS_00036960 [Batillaria attramentaria]|uniref:Uncharacterized protein n=1 Tax=Batillaria attramentaria TaxID=370345 RepID=A0ABD0JAR2_9CAEN